MKWIGQHIWDLITRFRNDVYFQSTQTSTDTEILTISSDGKIGKKNDLTQSGSEDIHVNNLSADGTPVDGEALIYREGVAVWCSPESLQLQVRNDEGATLPIGTPVYSKGEIGGSDRIKVGKADCSDPAKMPAIGITTSELDTSSNKDGFVRTSGVYNFNIPGFTGLQENDNLYVASGGGLTQSHPSGEGNLIQNMGIVLKTNGTQCQGLKVSSIDRTNAVPNLNENNIFLGNASNMAVSSPVSSLYHYQYITFLGNSTVQTNGDWEFPGANGISNHTWSIDGNSNGTTVGTTTITIAKTEQHAGVRIPHNCTLVGFFGMGRNSNGNRQFHGGLFVGTPDWGGTASITPTLRAYAAADNSPGGSYTARASKLEDLTRSHSLSAGEVIYPAIRGDGTTADTIQVSFTIVLKVPITT